MLKLEAIDHIHVFTPDRAKAEAWYREILKLGRVPELEHWAKSDGPLFITNAEGTVSLALFQRTAPTTKSTVAFRVTGPDFLSWQKHLGETIGSVEPVDHDHSWSLYFTDHDKNPFEITSYEYEWLEEHLQAKS